TDTGKGHFQAGTHVGGTAHDLMCGDTVVDLTQAELVGIRMLLAADDLGHHDVREGTRSRFGAVDLEARHRQALHELLCVQGGIDPLAQPALTDLHRYALSGTVSGSASRCRTTGADP